tara:strand:- start:375 stop:878 length:504 start_codon:yes stop_codon:yes gene_type:complete
MLKKDIIIYFNRLDEYLYQYFANIVECHLSFRVLYCRLKGETNMDTKLVLTIIGSVLSLIGVVFISIPKVVNEKTMSNLPSEAVGISALFRAANGGLGLALGLVAIYCRNLPPEYAKTVILSLGTGFIIVNAAIVSGKIRGFDDELPIPPMIIFGILTILAYYTALN